MTKTQKVATATGVTAAVLTAAAIFVMTDRPPLPPGFWRVGNFDVPCAETKPYINWINPQDGLLAYLRYDATALRVQTNRVDGADAGQGGSDHSFQRWLDGRMIPLRGGGPNGYVYPAPYRDAVLPVQPYPPPPEPLTICSEYRRLNGAAAKPCPSGELPPQYSQRITGTPQWQSGLATYRALIDAGCRVPVPTGPPGPTVPPGPVPTPPGPCPCPCTPGPAVTAPVRTPTRPVPNPTRTYPHARSRIRGPEFVDPT